MIKKFIKDNKITISIIILIYIYSIFTTKYYFEFSFSEFDIFAWCRYLFIRISFIILEVATVIYLKNFIRKLKNGDKETKSLLCFFLISLVINFILLILIWPGNWINDEIGVLANARMFKYYSWQNYLTVIYFSFCVMLFPTAVAIPVLQTIFISYAFSYFVNYIYKITKTKWVLLLNIILLLPPIIYNNLYPLRITMYTYIELLFLTWIYKKYKEKSDIKIQETIISAITIFILAFWRTEGIYYLAIPVIIYFLFRKNKNIIPKCIAMEIVALIFFMIFSSIDKYYDYNEYIKYKTTAIINPLSILLQKELNGDVQKEIEKIDKVIDVELLKENPSYWNIIVALDSNKGLYRDNFAENFGGVMSSYFKIVINNLPEFLKERWEVFLITNGKYEEENVYYSLNGLNDFTEEDTEFIRSNFLGEPISYTLRNNVLKFCRGKNVKMFWNVIPVATILIIILVAVSISKKIPEALLILNLFAKSALVFLTTPASFFMYYYPLYLEGILIIGASVIYIISKIVKRGEKSSNLT